MSLSVVMPVRGRRDRESRAVAGAVSTLPHARVLIVPHR